MFLIRGRVVTFHDVKNYFRRKGIHDLESFLGDTSDTSTAAPTTRIDCRTPEPPAEAEAGEGSINNPESQTTSKNRSLHRAFNFGTDHVKCSVVALPDPDHIDNMIPLNGSLSQLDELLHLGRNYYVAVFENPDWRSKKNSFDLSHLEAFYHHMLDGQLSLERACVKEAFASFDCAFDQMHHLLKQEVFLFLPYLYHMMLPHRDTHQQEVVSLLLGFVSQMGQSFPKLGPIQDSLALLRHMSVKDRTDSSKRVFRSILDHLRVEFEDDAPDELELSLSDICSQTRATLPIEQRLDNYKQTTIAIWKLAKDAEVLSGPTYTTLDDDSKVGSGEMRFSLHGDLKPNNIVWYAPEGIDDGIPGAWSVANLGLAPFRCRPEPFFNKDFSQRAREENFHRQWSEDHLLNGDLNFTGAQPFNSEASHLCRHYKTAHYHNVNFDAAIPRDASGLEYILALEPSAQNEASLADDIEAGDHGIIDFLEGIRGESFDAEGQGLLLEGQGIFELLL